MSVAEMPTRSSQTQEHLLLLRSLSSEVQRAMDAIATNDLEVLEGSIAVQQDLSERLSHLADQFSIASRASAASPSPLPGSGLMGEIRTASAELQRLIFRYSILLEHSSRSAALMASLLSSFQGQLQEGSGTRPKVQTWSCQI